MVLFGYPFGIFRGAMLKERVTGQGKLVLLAGGGRFYTDIATRFVRSERSLDEIAASPYSKKFVENILNSGHVAALEFGFFLFGAEGYSRVAEVQLVRKRLASYLIKRMPGTRWQACLLRRLPEKGRRLQSQGDAARRS